MAECLESVVKTAQRNSENMEKSSKFQQSLKIAVFYQHLFWWKPNASGPQIGSLRIVCTCISMIER